MRANYFNYTYDSFKHNPSTYKHYSDYYKFKGQLALILKQGVQNCDIERIQNKIIESYSKSNLTDTQYYTLMQYVMNIEAEASLFNYNSSKKITEHLKDKRPKHEQHVK